MIADIRAVTNADLPALFAYLGDQLTENGRDGNPLFQPVPRTDEPVVPLAVRSRFTNGLATPVGEPQWRRAWIALDEDGAITGHVDLRARQPGSDHRALLGMGVHRHRRRLGLGVRLIETATGWAGLQGFSWIDLEVLSANGPAVALYQRCGFNTVGEFQDMYRIDGESHACTLMSLRIAQCSNPARHKYTAL